MNEERYKATANLSAILAENQRTQSWLARKVGISVTLMHYIVQGERTMSRDVANNIADIFGVPLFLIAESASADVDATEMNVA